MAIDQVVKVTIFIEQQDGIKKEIVVEQARGFTFVEEFSKDEYIGPLGLASRYDIPPFPILERVEVSFRPIDSGRGYYQLREIGEATTADDLDPAAAPRCTCQGPSPCSDGPDVDCPQHGDGLAAARDGEAAAPTRTVEQVDAAVRSVSSADGFEYDPDTVTFVCGVLDALGIGVREP